MTDMLARLGTETALLRTRMEGLARQVSTGHRAPALGEIAAEQPRAVSLRAEMGRREVYTRAMTQADARIETTQGALGRLTDIAREFRTDVAMRVGSRDAESLATVATRARAALEEVGHLLNSRFAGEYLFAGSDLANAPVPDPAGLADGPMAAGIAAAVGTLAVGNGAAVAAATITVAQGDDTPFSAHVASFPAGTDEARRGVPAGDGQVIRYGLHADRNTEASSTGATTGGWARDLMRNLMVLAALDPAQMATGADFDAVVTSVREGFASAEEALGEERGSLGIVQARIESALSRHEAVTVTLADQLAGIEEVDVAEALTKLQSVQATLEASYRAMASIARLSLASYLA